MFGWLKSISSGKRTLQGKQHSDVRVMRARYDAAVTTDENRRHWAHADGLSPNSSLSPDVRSTLRKRARYEVANNSYARGIVQTLANDVEQKEADLTARIKAVEEEKARIERARASQRRT